MKTYVVIGNSAAGLTAVKNLRQLDKESRIICISKEKEKPYNKCKLEGFLAGKLQERDVQTFFKQILEDKNIDLLLGKRVSKISSDNKYVLLENGQKISYDKLLIAVGASAIKPKILGGNLEGVFTFHTLHDVKRILNFIAKNKTKKVLVIGSGMTGLECANALHDRGLDVSVIERNMHVLSGQSDQVGSKIIEKNMEKLGISVYLGERVKEFTGENGIVKQVVLESGKTIEADLVICAIGVRPNVRLAKEAGIKLDNCGVLTNDYMQTSVQDIYAAGDVACVKDFVTGNTIRSCTWPDACMQAIVAAKSMVLCWQKYIGAFSLAFSEFFGVKFASCGDISGTGEIYKIYIKNQDNYYNKVLIKDGIIKGFLLVGDTNKLGVLNRYLMSGQKVDIEKIYNN